jgi:hypothetical protein
LTGLLVQPDLAVVSREKLLLRKGRMRGRVIGPDAFLARYGLGPAVSAQAGGVPT